MDNSLNKTHSKRRRRRAILFRIGVLVLLAAALTASATAASIWSYAGQTSKRPAQAAIILGATVHGTEPAPVFRERIKHAVELYRTGVVHKLIFTGGYGSGAQISESEAARRYAIDMGVPAIDILSEDRSHSTMGNLKFAREAARANGLHTFVIVSDPLHMMRAMTISADLKMQAEPSPTPTSRYNSFSSKAGFLARETYFYLAYRLGLSSGR